LETAFGSEHGTKRQDAKIKKWEIPLNIYIQGQPTDSDLAALEKISGHARAVGLDVNFLNQLGEQNFDVYLVPHAQFRGYVHSSISDELIAANQGMGWGWARQDGNFYKAAIIINSMMSEGNRTHFLMEEFYQMLGLGQDTLTHPESITYALPSSTTELSAHDITNLGILYHPSVNSGMSPNEVRSVIRVIDTPLDN